MKNKILCCILILFLCVGSLTTQAFAAPEAEGEEAAAEEVLFPAEEETAEEEQPFADESDPGEAGQQEEEQPEFQVTDPSDPWMEIQTEEGETELPEFRLEEKAEEGKPEESGSVDEELFAKEADEMESGRVEVDNDELLMGYLEQELLGQGRINLSKRSIDLGSRLSETNKILYDALKERAEEIVAGTQTSTVLTVSISGSSSSLNGKKWYAEDLGIDSIGEVVDGKFVEAQGFRQTFYDAVGYSAGKTMISVLRDCPSEMFWFGYEYSTTVFFRVFRETATGNLYVMLPLNWTANVKVTREYAALEEYTDKDGNVLPYHPYKINSDRIDTVNSAIANAQQIVSDNTCTNDYDTLFYYFSTVSSLSEYNSEAAGSEPEGGGDPWQVIYLFDGDPDTKVVCEGYAKGMQYLCDMTAFENADIACYCVSGELYRGKPQEAGSIDLGFHMWNIVHMDDGFNYLVDPTNSDADSPWGFLAPYSEGNVTDGYTIDAKNRSYTFVYDGGEDSNTWLVYREEDLILSAYKYVAVRTPAGLKASVSGNNVSLEWTCDGNPGGFYISRSEDGYNYFDVGRVRDGETRKWTDEEVPDGVHYYRICSFVSREDGREIESSFSAAVSVFVLQAPSIRGLANSNTKIRIDWSKVQAADGYKIYYSVNGSSFQYIKTISSPSTLTWYGLADQTVSGDKVKVKIRAYKVIDGKNRYGAYSETASVVRLERRSISKVSNTFSGITVRWNQDSGADGYIVYRSVGDSAYTAVRTVSKNTTVKWTDTNVTAGKKYSYMVVSYKKWNGVKYLSALSVGKVIYRIEQPEIRSLTKASDGVVISWEKTEKASGYSIYRSANGGSYRCIRTVSSGAAGSYKDKKAVNKGTVYTYRIIAFKTVSDVRYNSYHSEEKSIKIN